MHLTSVGAFPVEVEAAVEILRPSGCLIRNVSEPHCAGPGISFGSHFLVAVFRGFRLLFEYHLVFRVLDDPILEFMN